MQKCNGYVGFYVKMPKRGTPPLKRGVFLWTFGNLPPSGREPFFGFPGGPPGFGVKNAKKPVFWANFHYVWPGICCFLAENGQFCKKMSFFAHFVGFSYKSSSRGLFVAFMPPKSTYKSIFTTRIFYLLNVLFCGKIQNVTSFPCI